MREPVPWKAWLWSAASTFLLCGIVGALAGLVTHRPEFLYYSLGLALILEVAAIIAMILDSFGMPGGLIVGVLLFFPWSLLALLLFRKEVPWEKWRLRRKPRGAP